MNVSEPARTFGRQLPQGVDWACVRRFARALAAVDRGTVSGDPVIRDLRLATTGLTRPEPLTLLPGHGAAADFSAASAALHRALSTLENRALAEATPCALAELIAEVDAAGRALDRPDFGPVPTDALAARFRELYAGMVRVRSVSTRLHRAWETVR